MGRWPWSDKALDSLDRAEGRINLWHGAVRSGKTTCSLVAWLMFVRRAPPGELLMAAKTERTLKRNILDLAERLAGTQNFRKDRSQGELWLYGRRVYLAGAHDEGSEAKIRGLTLAGAYGDELSLWPESFFRMLLSRLSVQGARLFGTTNPDGPHHWLKAGYLDRAAELDMQAFHFELADNPSLDPAYVRALEAEYGRGTLWHRRFIRGLWVQAEGAVYDFFDEGAHVLGHLPFRQPDHLDLACDYGTANATSVGLYGSWRAPVEGLRCARLRGYYHSGKESGRQKTDSEYADAIDAWLGAALREVLGEPGLEARQARARLRWVVLDPSAASFRTELRRRGYAVRAADNDVLNGIRTVSRLMKGGEFAIGPDRSNLTLVSQVGGYAWDPKAQARGQDRPLKQEDHAVDELRYYLHTVHGTSGADGAALRALGR